MHNSAPNTGQVLHLAMAKNLRSTFLLNMSHRIGSESAGRGGERLVADSEAGREESRREKFLMLL